MSGLYNQIKDRVELLDKDTDWIIKEWST